VASVAKASVVVAFASAFMPQAGLSAVAPALEAQQAAFGAGAAVASAAVVTDSFLALRAFLSVVVSWAVAVAMKATTATKVSRMRMGLS
jgi:hypothetical protein